MMLRKLFVFALMGLWIGTGWAQLRRPKNIVILIGDGMGLSQLTAGWVYGRDYLPLRKFTHVGLMTVNPVDALITDSGAGATAMACGQKTKVKMLGVDSSGNPLKNIFEIAREHKKKVGVISTVAVVDATPAAFVVHVPNRRMYDTIAERFFDNLPDVVIGGGRKFFEPHLAMEKHSKRWPLLRKGYDIVYDIDKIATSGRRGLLALVAEVDLPPASQRGDFLLDSWLTAHRILGEGRHGYVLMIESGQIDRAAHAHDEVWLRQEMADFYELISIVLARAAKDGDMLVLLLADHETGGLSVVDGDLETGETQLHWATTHHTADLIPVFAYGPGSELFSGVYDNTDIFRKLRRLIEGDRPAKHKRPSGRRHGNSGVRPLPPLPRRAP